VGRRPPKRRKGLGLRQLGAHGHKGLGHQAAGAPSRVREHALDLLRLGRRQRPQDLQLSLGDIFAQDLDDIVGLHLLEEHRRRSGVEAAHERPGRGKVGFAQHVGGLRRGEQHKDARLFIIVEPVDHVGDIRRVVPSEQRAHILQPPFFQRLADQLLQAVESHHRCHCVLVSFHALCHP